MSIIGWLVLGLIAGFIASKVVNKTGEGLVLDIVLGIVGAVVGGFLFTQFGATGVTGLNLYSMFVAVIGAVVVLVVYHAVVGGAEASELRMSQRGTTPVDDKPLAGRDTITGATRGVVQIRVTPKTRNVFTINALWISSVT